MWINNTSGPPPNFMIFFQTPFDVEAAANGCIRILAVFTRQTVEKHGTFKVRNNGLDQLSLASSFRAKTVTNISLFLC